MKIQEIFSQNTLNFTNMKPLAVLKLIRTFCRFCFTLVQLRIKNQEIFRGVIQLIGALNSRLTPQKVAQISKIRVISQNIQNAISVLGDFTEVISLTQDLESAYFDKSTKDGYNSSSLIISNAFTQFFGHARLAAILIQASILELTQNNFAIIASRFSNRWLFLKYFSKWVPVIEVDELIQSQIQLFELKSIAPMNLIHFDDQISDLTLATFTVGKLWEIERRGPFLNVSEEDNQYGKDCLQEYGYSTEDWFVSFSTRNSKNYAFERNCDADTYLEGLNLILDAGGWIFHMGKTDTESVALVHPRYVDLTSNHCERLDIFLLGRARFHIGAASGVSEIPCLFGTPTLWTNVPRILQSEWKPDTLILPKIEQTSGGSARPIADCLQDVGKTVLRSAKFRDNTSDEIREAVREMLNGSAFKGSLQQKFQKLLHANGAPDYSVSEYFLRKHERLFF